MKSRYTLLVHVLNDYLDHGLGVSQLDIKRASSHVDDHHWNEVLLPSLDDALLRGLSTGTYSPVAGFSKQRGTQLPRFLHGLWTKVFSLDGSLLIDPDISSIRAIRQISNLHKKIFEVCNDEIVTRSIESFISTDRALCTTVELDDILPHVFSKLFGPMLSRIYHCDRVGKHGPGAVAEKLDSINRWDFPNVRSSLLDRYGEDFFYASYSEYLNRYPSTRDEYGRLVAVPKTASKPRLISIEPAAHQYAQQGLMSILYRELSRYPVTNILDQSRNQELARIGSIDGALATIDLSEASDRVSMRLVRHIFKNHSWFLDELEDLRTKAVYVAEGRLVPLNKFASMGSALTFPIQVMVFTTIICAAMYGHSAKESLLSMPDMGVYGDDIIVPSTCAHTVMQLLERSGLVVNQSKSFSTGLFRESCGADYYAGHNIRPVYVRKHIPTSRHHVSQLISISETAWFLHDASLWRSAQYLTDIITNILGDCKGIRPVRKYGDEPGSLGIGFISTPYGNYPKRRWNKSLQRSEWLMPSPRAKRKAVRATNRAMLAAALTAVKGSYTDLRSGVPESDPRALTHDGRPVGAFITHRWTSIS